MNEISISHFKTVKNHPYLRALADVQVNKLTLRGLRLEDSGKGTLTLGFPGRKIQGHWQVVYETEDTRTHSQLLQCLVAHYRGNQLGAAA